MMRYYTCDTSVIISRKLSDLPDNFLFSSVSAIGTDNWDDFKAIQRYCHLKLIKGSDFFK